MAIGKQAVLILMLILGSAAASAQSRLDTIRARGVLRVGTTGDYAPFTSKVAGTEAFQGFDIDQANDLAHVLGVRAIFIETSWPTMEADLHADRFDIAMGGVSITADRRADGALSTPYLQDGKTPIARCAEVDRFSTIAQINRSGTRVVVNPGGTNERFARAHLPDAQLRIVPDNRAVFDEIAAGRADVMVTDATETRLQAKRHPGVLCAVHPDAPFEPAQKAYWFARDDAFAAAVDNWLQSEHADGRLAARLRQWID